MNEVPRQEDQTFVIKVTKDIDVEYSEIGFRAKILFGDGQMQNDIVRFVFDDHQATNLNEIFKKYMAYKIHGRFELIRDYGYWCKYKLVGLFDIVPVTLEDQLQYLHEQQIKLQNKNYLRTATSQERDEQRRDWKAESERTKRFNIAEKTWTQTVATLEPLIIQAARISERMTLMGISKRLELTFSGSMVLVQNPNYRGALAAYRRAMDSANLDTAKLDHLFCLDDVGILDLPIVYERWCFLRIIRTLIEHFRLSPEPTYQDKIFQKFSYGGGARSSLTINFEREEFGRKVMFEYQPLIRREGLPDRIPDFALTVHPTETPAKVLSEEYFAKLIIDAKCKRFAPIIPNRDGARLSDELNELLTIRKYDEEGQNRVFVIYPGWDSNSSDHWSQYCHYGGWYFTPNPESRPEWDCGNPDHTHGAVLLRPGISDHLTRLLLMHFYLGLEETLQLREREEPRFPPICPICGGVRMSSCPPQNVNRSSWTNPNAVWCIECGQMIVRNYSRTCGTRLWKLGGYWTFHETNPLNPYNIKCPHCGDFL